MMEAEYTTSGRYSGIVVTWTDDDGVRHGWSVAWFSGRLFPCQR